jgi:hypothetical protein
MQSKAKTVDDYLASLPADRRAPIAAVRDVVLRNLDAGYEEGIQYGMIGWYVPHRVFPAGYHADPKQPLPFAALASQKNHMSLYLMGVYGGAGADSGTETGDARWFREAWARTGKKLDMGKACVRFKKIEDLALDVIGEAIRRLPAKAYVAAYTAVRAAASAAPRAKTSKPSKPKPTAVTTAKKPAPPNAKKAKKASSARAKATR